MAGNPLPPIVLAAGVNATQLQGKSISTTAPTNGQVLAWVSGTSKWTPTNAGGGGGYNPGSVPVEVQFAFAVNGGNDVVFTNPPTNGNLLVAMSSSPNAQNPGSGWTRQVINSSGTDFKTVMTKVAGPGESATQSPITGSSGTGGITCWELSNAAAGFLAAAQQGQQTGNVTNSVLLPNVTNGIGLAGVFAENQNITAVYNGGTQDVLDNSGSRKIAAGHVDFSASPMVGILAKFAASTGYNCMAVLIGS